MKKTSHQTADSVETTEATTKEIPQENSPEVAAPETAIPVVEDPLVTLQAELDKYRDQAMRTAADLENYRKRVIREKEEAVRYANTSLLEKLIPILDNFEMGLDAAKGSADASATSILQGLSMVQRQLNDFLKDHGLLVIDTEGESFDPKLHDAIGYEPHDTLPEGKIISQMRRGYQLAQRLVRPASVIVSKGPQTAQN